MKLNLFKILTIILVSFNFSYAGIFDFLEKKIEEKALQKTHNDNKINNINTNSNNSNNKKKTKTNNIVNTNKLKNNKNIKSKKNNLNFNNITFIKKDKNKENIENNNIKNKNINTNINNINKTNKEIKKINVKDKLKKLLPINKIQTDNININKMKKNDFNKMSSDEKIIFKKGNNVNIQNDILNKEIKKIEKELNNNPRMQKQYLILLKIKIDKYLENYQFNKTIDILEKINQFSFVSKKLKEKFNDYVYWKILKHFLTMKNITVNEKIKSYKLLSRILNLIDKNFNFETNFDYLVFNYLKQKINSGNDITNLINKYYQYGISDLNLYYKIFLILDSEYSYQNPNRTPLYLYIKDKFFDFYSKNKIKISPILIKQFLKIIFLYQNNYNITIKDILLDLKYQNPLDSFVYYYLGLYYKNNEDYNLMEYNLKKAIKYNIFNIPAWKELITYYLNKKQKIFSKINDIELNNPNTYKNDSNYKKLKFEMEKLDYQLKNIFNYIFTNLKIDNQKDYLYLKEKEGLYYFLLGTYNKNIKDLKKSLKIFKETNNEIKIKQIQNYIKILQENE